MLKMKHRSLVKLFIALSLFMVFCLTSTALYSEETENENHADEAYKAYKAGHEAFPTDLELQNCCICKKLTV